MSWASLTDSEIKPSWPSSCCSWINSLGHLLVVHGYACTSKNIVPNLCVFISLMTRGNLRLQSISTAFICTKTVLLLTMIFPEIYRRYFIFVVENKWPARLLIEKSSIFDSFKFSREVYIWMTAHKRVMLRCLTHHTLFC